MSYSYATQRPNVFTESGQKMFLQIRDKAKELIARSGAASCDKIICGCSGDSWDMLACVDRLVELGEFVRDSEHTKQGQSAPPVRVMQVGFTGTQRGMTEAQWATLWHLLVARAPGDFHEGDCIGSDAQAAHGARLAGFRIIGHPPGNPTKRAHFSADEWRKPLPYLVRNHNIVDASEEMLATPSEFEEQLRSGAWTTIRYARKVGRRVAVILPDGRLL